MWEKNTGNSIKSEDNHISHNNPLANGMRHNKNVLDLLSISLRLSLSTVFLIARFFWLAKFYFLCERKYLCLDSWNGNACRIPMLGFWRTRKTACANKMFFNSTAVSFHEKWKCAYFGLIFIRFFVCFVAFCVFLLWTFSNCLKMGHFIFYIVIVQRNNSTSWNIYLIIVWNKGVAIMMISLCLHWIAQW